jgi:catalase-peroxidase
MLNLTAPEMTALVGGLRSIGANTGGSRHGVFTDRPGVLTNDFFVHLLDMGTVWSPTDSAEHAYEGRDRVTGERGGRPRRWTSCSAPTQSLRAVAEIYASADGPRVRAADFVAAWDKVMNLDRFDLRRA